MKLKALSMEDKDVDQWWGVVQDIVQKDMGEVCRRYERNESYINTEKIIWKQSCHHLSMSL
jgi:hypothetical protein